jgi:DNA polymerase III subunit gamma/tau
VGRTAARTLCNCRRRTASGPEGSSAKPILQCGQVRRVAVGPIDHIRPLGVSAVAYQVLARKWRPQRFDEVVGQQAVTRTLRNAISSGRIAHAFVFAGSRGCGKTTTARILARALNCEQGPTPDPCGTCDACVEIAQGRDIDVLEIDAASHTGIDNIREVVIAGLAITPVRNRYKVFIIDEVHQLSTASFNALLKSIEEPPPHVVFMMATTELQKIPDTILSRSQVFEFRTIPATLIVEQLRRIAVAEGLEVPDAALALVARAAEGSMRDAQSALDQVMSFAGQTIAAEDVSAVLGLVGRDLLFDMIDAVVAEDGPRAFALAERASESGQDLRLVCRDLMGVVRDLVLLSVDPDRLGSADLLEGERQRLAEIGQRFSREDLLRAFDLLTKAEQEIRVASHPRYYFEMVLLRWMHLRKLVPLADLIENLGGGGSPQADRGAPATGRPAAGRASLTAPARPTIAAPPAARRVSASSPASAPPPATPSPAGPLSGPALKDALLAEIRTTRGMFYNVHVATAERVDVVDDRVVFTFGPDKAAARSNVEGNREWLEGLAMRLAGRKVTVAAVLGDAPQAAPDAAGSAQEPAGPPKRDLRAEALASPAVQGLLEVFPAEIRDVEEM